MEITAILIPTHQRAPIELRRLGHRDVAAYRALVGGNIQVVDLDAPPASMYVNEEGKLLHLPINMRATHVVWAHNERLRNEDIIMGDAFIVGPVDRNGDDLTVPQGYIDLLFPAEPFRVEVLARSETVWATNAMTYDTWEQAYIAASSLHRRWTLAEKLRIVPSSTPTQARYEEGSEDIG